jgi:hypothetical protein
MSNYKIMNRDLSGTSLEGLSAPGYYERNKESHLNPKSTCYGDVLVSTKQVYSGFQFKLKIYFRGHFYWKPAIMFKPKWGQYWFHWLFFMFWAEPVFTSKIDKVIKDHLKEQVGEAFHGL